MKLIVISPSEEKKDEIANVIKLLEMGLEEFHLRKPKMSTGKMREYIKSIPAHFHNRIIIHSHHHLALEFDLLGLHITRVHSKKWFRLWFTGLRLSLKGKTIVRTASFRKLSSLYEEKNVYNHVFLNPVFDSLSGKFQSGFNEFSLQAALQKTPHKVVARGGIDKDKIEKVKALGFYGLAFYSAVWKKPDPEKAFIEILEKFREVESVTA